MMHAVQWILREMPHVANRRYKQNDPEIVALLINALKHDPKLLSIQDKRGNTPLNYVRRHQWSEWNQYLLKTKTAEELLPKTLDACITK